VTDSPIDLAIIIALQEEFEQLHAQIKDRCTPVQDPDTKDYDYVFTWPAASAQSYRCVASSAGKMGERKAALVTQRLLARWQPASVVVLGIAGGIDRDVRLGDVVAATLVESYLEDAKAVETPEPGRFDFRLAGDAFRPSGDLLKEVRISSSPTPACSKAGRRTAGGRCTTPCPPRSANARPSPRCWKTVRACGTARWLADPSSAPRRPSPTG